MDSEEKLELLKEVFTKEILEQLKRMDSERIKDYLECCFLFLHSNDIILLESSLKTMNLIINNEQ